MTTPRQTRSDVPTVERLRELVELPLPLRLGRGAAEHFFLRDIYLDTADAQLAARGVICRLRVREGRQQLAVFVSDTGAIGDQALPHVADVDESDARRAVLGFSPPARVLRAMLDPAQLEIAYTVHTQRFVRVSDRRLLRFSQYQFAYDIAAVERNSIVRDFQELRVRRLRNGPPSLARISDALHETYGLKPLLVGRFERERVLAASLDREAQKRAVATGAAVALVVLDKGKIGCHSNRGLLRLPVAEGSGEGACRHLLLEHFGSGVGNLRLIGNVPAEEGGRALEVWLARHVRHGREASGDGVMMWLTLEQLIARVGTGSLRDRETLAALFIAARSDLINTPTSVDIAAVPTAPPPSRSTDPPPPLPTSPPPPRPVTGDDGEEGSSDRLLDADMSQLEFNARVLAMAEDPAVPVLERLQYLGIVSANNDEFFSVRIGALKRRALGDTDEHRIMRAGDLLASLTPAVRAMTRRQEQALEQCMRELRPHGVHIVPWTDLNADEQETLRKYFHDVVFPALTPKAVTEAPGFPLPNVVSGSLAFAVMVKDPQTGPLHLTFVRVPSMLNRLIPIRDGRSFVLLEQLIREEIDRLYPGRSVLQAYLFRVTRSGELDADEAAAGDLLQSMEEDAKRRAGNAVVRVEVEKQMPEKLRAVLLNELRFDTSGEPLPIGADEVHETDAPLDLTMLKELGGLPLPALRFPAMQARAPFEQEASIFDAVRERDRLVHHPYDDFASSVQRFISEAADDPQVTAMKVTLYRAGERSAIVDALMRAANAGKDVAAFVELKARFDEARNVAWARRLGDAGVHVVYGLVGLKNHAKLALVTRLEGESVRRYVHVGTGNYNAGTARFYTDVGIFSADPELGADVNDLFNELTGSSRWPRGNYRRLLVAPHAMLPGLLARVQREIDHARAGRPARIRLKLNGLSDQELIEALYRASQEGVDVFLVVRGLCRLRPGTPGISERIRVFSILGRFLEHARIYEFANGGDPECFIGSADWRTRNVRRRVEVVAPVLDVRCRAYLRALLDRELNDESAWELRTDGTYARREAAPEPSTVAQSYYSLSSQLPLQQREDLAPA